jgi:hypothetical protein
MQGKSGSLIGLALFYKYLLLVLKTGMLSCKLNSLGSILRRHNLQEETVQALERLAQCLEVI